MLILPIVNNKRVMNVEIKLKGAYKMRQRVTSRDVKAGDIIVNREKYSESSFHGSKDAKAPIDFIRSKSLLYPRDFLVTTREEMETGSYDVYQVPQPPKKVSDGLDELYSKSITDMLCEIPGKPQRGRYVSFQDLGIEENLSDEKIDTLQRIIKDERDSSTWAELFQKSGISDLPDTAAFLNHFECTVLSDTTIPEDSLQDTLKALSNINTRDYRNLKKYYRMAQTNADIYMKISYISKIVFDKPMTLKHADASKQKQYIKKIEEGEYRDVA
ncbi:MAG: hypothetical protein IKF71_04950 [Bacilli bacterium]|nr:hypothetical protein [Bacilli bacterium]